MKPKVILLVEDNPSDVALTQRALAKSRIANELAVAEDGQEALDYLFGPGAQTEQPLPELPALVLLDLKLPKLNGREVLQRLRQDTRLRNVPVVILTSSSQDEDVIAAYLHGANSYVRKPVLFEPFMAAVKQLGLYWVLLNQPAPDR